MSVLGRERPAAISIEIKSIDDTSNFDEFPESDILKPTGNPTNSLYCCLTSALFPPSFGVMFTDQVATSNHPETDYKNKDWVFINYTYKRFEGLTARGAIPSYMKAAK
ncbi:hypothetical protein QTO34_001594 [Cnephaeus nilssonii]|uniref:Protein kinase C-terminal domain-containing protein n=1 Tax=Cnephaeus nilssonii TaxID=3371016 RepID=A0AA40LNN9_CNENI|nr:hypothetical protein QTO34_001594 [Eptesicus nilssonii]